MPMDFVIVQHIPEMSIHFRHISYLSDSKKQAGMLE